MSDHTIQSQLDEARAECERLKAELSAAKERPTKEDYAKKGIEALNWREIAERAKEDHLRVRDECFAWMEAYREAAASDKESREALEACTDRNCECACHASNFDFGKGTMTIKGKAVVNPDFIEFLRDGTTYEIRALDEQKHTYKVLCGHCGDFHDVDYKCMRQP